MNKSTPAVSIIVPAFNTGPYIRKCIESIISQTFSDWELFVVDDGSTDDTYDTALSISETDDRITVIRTENKGVSDARNLCLDRAAGEYLCFIDSDDIVEPGYLAELVRCATETRADIAQCSFSYVYGDGRVVPDPDRASGVYQNNGEIMRAFFNGPAGDIRVGTWAKLFRRDKFGSIRFDGGLRVYEDALYTYQCCRLAERAASTDGLLYNYLQREGSAMNSRLPDICNDYFVVFEKQAEDYKDNGFIRKKIARREAETALWLMNTVIAAGKEDKLWDLRRKALKNYSAVFFSSAPFSLKVKLTGLALMPHVYFALLKRR